MSDYKAVIIGATGLIGSALTDLLLKDDRFTEVKVLVRKFTGLPHSKLKVVTTDFGNVEQIKNNLGKGDFIFCCIGTTKSKVKGDMALYRKIDIEIPETVAKAGSENGYKKFMVVSSVGANINASNYYLKIKGEAEKRILSYSFDATHIFRPSFLTGNRKENRPVEKIMSPVVKLLSPLFIGSLSKYKAIEAKDVAQAMIAAALSKVNGTHVYHYDEMRALIN